MKRGASYCDTYIDLLLLPLSLSLLLLLLLLLSFTSLRHDRCHTGCRTGGDESAEERGHDHP